MLGQLQKNVYDAPLKFCAEGTGWKRDGFCSHRKADGGKHLVCARMTNRFLDFTKERGNDLTSPSGSFKGLKEGDKWCICASRYAEAKREGMEPEDVDWSATHKKALEWNVTQPEESSSSS